MTATVACRRQLARDLLGDLRRVDARLDDNKAQIRDALAATTSTLTQIHGLGVVLAAKLLGHVGDIRRFPSQDHFASYTATAPWSCPGPVDALGLGTVRLQGSRWGASSRSRRGICRATSSSTARGGVSRTVVVLSADGTLRAWPPGS